MNSNLELPPLVGAVAHGFVTRIKDAPRRAFSPDCGLNGLTLNFTNKIALPLAARRRGRVQDLLHHGVARGLYGGSSWIADEDWRLPFGVERPSEAGES